MRLKSTKSYLVCSYSSSFSYLPSSMKSNISSSESFFTSSLKSMIVSSLASAHALRITSSFSFTKMSKMRKVALVISYCLTYGSSSMLGSPLRPNSSHFLRRKKREGPVYSFNRKAFHLRMSMIRFS